MSGDESAFFVERPETYSCQYYGPCDGSPLGGVDYIAFCENSKVTMDPFEGLVSSTKLLLKDGELGTYDTHK